MKLTWSFQNNKRTKFFTVCLNPVMQKTLILDDITEGQANRCRSSRLDTAGKGVNVIRVLRQLGAEVVHLTQLDGFLVDEFLKKIHEDHLNIEWVPSGAEIRFCYTLINRKHRTITEIVEEGEPVSKETEKNIWSHYTRLLKESDVIIISGSKAPGFSDKIIPDMVKEAKNQNKFVILDFRGNDLKNSIPYSPDIIKPNLFEFTQTFFPDNHKIEEEPLGSLLPDIEKKMNEFYYSLGITTILTNGKQETLYTLEGSVKKLFPETIKPINTIGSGDAFTAGLAWKISQGEALKEAIEFAHICGAKNARLLRPGVIM